MGTNTSPFTKHITYSFKVRGEDYAILSFSASCIEIEETRKNGHFYGVLHLQPDGKWQLENDAREHLAEYMSDKEAPAIEAFFNEHGLPRGDQ